MHHFSALILQVIGLCSINSVRLSLPSPIYRNTEKIRELLSRNRPAEAVKTAWGCKHQRHFSLPLAREIAHAEHAARYWKESVESWKAVCGFPMGTGSGDWLQLAKVQGAAGYCEDAIGTLHKMKELYLDDSVEVNSLLARLQTQQAGYGRVNQRVLACQPGSYQITYLKNKRPSSTVVITFGLIHSDFHSTPFGFPFITRQGFDHIHVAHERFTFYQLLDLNVFLDAVGEICQGKNVVAYGSSLGGYAAFYFGGPLGARILAASPRNSTDDCITRVSKHWAHVKWRHGKISDHQKSPEKPIVFWDPVTDKRDKIYLEERILPAYPDLELIPIPLGGHSTFKYLRDKKILKEVFLSAVRGDFSAAKTKKALGLSTDAAGESERSSPDAENPFP